MIDKDNRLKNIESRLLKLETDQKTISHVLSDLALKSTGIWESIKISFKKLQEVMKAERAVIVGKIQGLERKKGLETNPAIISSEMEIASKKLMRKLDK